MNVARLVLPCTAREGIAQQRRENDRLEERLDDRIVITITFAAYALPGAHVYWREMGHFKAVLAHSSSNTAVTDIQSDLFQLFGHPWYGTYV